MTPEELRRRLADPFPASVVGFKAQSVKNGRALAVAYIDARDVMDRLDDVFGVAGWEDNYIVMPGGEVLCTLRVRVGDEWVTKQDVGSPSEQPDAGDRAKAAVSDALKRAAVKLGVGRYLYSLPATWADYDPARKQLTGTPRLPAWALPGGSGRPDAAAAPAPAPAPKPAPQQQPAQPARDNSQLVRDYQQAYENCPDLPTFDSISQQVKADRRNHVLTDGDCDQIRTVAVRVNNRLRAEQPQAAA